MNRLEMKQKAIRYYNNNKVPEQLERLLNTMFMEDPQDIYGYMAEYFSTLSKPASITKITCEPSLSASGYKTLKSTVYCCINGQEKKICCLDFLKDVRRVLPKAPSISRRPSAKNVKKDSKGKPATAGKKDQMLATDVGANGDASLDTPKYSYSIEHVMESMGNAMIPQLVDSNLGMDCIDEILRQCTEVLLANVNPLETHKSTDLFKENADALEDHGSPSKQIEDKFQNVQITVNSDVTIATKTSAQSTTKDVTQAKLEINMASFFVSLLVAFARSELEQLSLYRALSPERATKDFNLPIPAVSFLTCDHTTPGKLVMFNDVLVLPKPTMDLRKGIDMVITVLRSFEKELVNKFGPNGGLKNSHGLLTPSFDKPEPVFELLSQTVKNELQVEFEEHFDLILNIGAHDLYDEEKKKYDIMKGASKPVEELMNLYNSWLDIYPIVGLIDPVSNKDEHGVSLIYEELSSKCFIINTQFSSIEQIHEMIESRRVDGAVLHPERFYTAVSDAREQLEFLHGVNGVLMMTDDWNVSQTTCTAVDMSVSLNATFLRVSSPDNTGATTLRRYLEILEETGEESSIHFKDGYVFRTKLPNVDEEEEENGNEDKEEGEKVDGNDVLDEVTGER